MAAKLVIQVISEGAQKVIGEINNIKEQANSATQQTTNKLNSVAGKLDAASTKTGAWAAKWAPLSVAATAFLTKGVMGASDVTEAINKTEVAFGEAADSMVKFADGSATKFGETKAQVLDTASTFGLLGLEADKTKDIIGRIADVGSLQNRSFKDVSGDFISAMNGSTEAVEKYGIKLKQTDLAQFMVEQGMAANTKEASKLMNSMDSTGKQQLIYAKIIADTSNAEGDMANNKETLAVRSKILQAQLSELATKIGSALLPAVENIVNSLSGFVEGLSNMPESTLTFIAGLLTALAAIAPVLKVVSFAFSTMASLVRGIAIAIKLVTAAQLLFNAALKANPIGLIITVIVAIIAALVALYNKNEAFRNMVNNVINAVVTKWNEFKTMIGALWVWLQAKFAAAKEFIMTPFRVGITWVQNKWTAFKTFIGGLVSWIGSKLAGVKEFIIAPFRAGLNWVQNKWNALTTSMSKAISGIGTGISNMFSSAIQGIKNTINSYLIGPLNSAIGVINKIPGVKIGSIPQLAKGGIVSGPINAIVGEAGPEAVIPLKDAVLAKIGQAIVMAGGNGGGGTYNSDGSVTIENLYISANKVDEASLIALLKKLSKQSGG